MNEQKTIPTLHHLTSSISFPVLMALEEANILRPHGLKYNLEIYPRLAQGAPESLKKISPLGKSPIMVIETVQGKDKGSREVLTESRYLIQYISHEYTDDRLSPANDTDKKRDAYMQEIIYNTFLKKVDLTLPFNIIPSFFPWGLSPLIHALFSPMINHFFKDLGDIYAYLDDNLSDHQPWFSGAQFGIADLLAVFPMSVVVQRRFAWDPSKYPKLARWHAEVTARPAYRAALQKGGTFNVATWM